MAVKLKHRIAAAVVPFVAGLLIRFLHLTMRIERVNFSGLKERLDSGGQIILAFWHGRLLMMPYSYPGNKISVLVSQHRDGELIARTVAKFGIGCIRGSTTRGWMAGVKGIFKAIKDGRDIAITPDGPKGPRARVQAGVVHIAAKTGLPIYPVTFDTHQRKVFNTWDGFLLPWPFTKGVFLYADPMTIPKDADEDTLEEKRLELEKKMNDLDEAVKKYL
ncbi:MAG: lysophospholipid acyltransferase family protein [Deltaproteobacteria bacterium]|nr:lysophospholipid acyltransferase family protein [Deltaproteobacteria bacterium]